MIMDPNDIRNKLTQIFQFLQALDQIKNPVEKDVQKQLWNLWFVKLPDHDCIDIASTFRGLENGNPSEEEAAPVGKDYILRIIRPQSLSVPQPPEEIREWLDPGWANCNKAVTIHQITVLDEEGNEIPTNLSDNEAALKLYNKWLIERDEWAEKQKVINQVQGVFESVYALYSRIQRESEQVELVLGDGILNWPLPNGVTVNHPLLLQRVDLVFDPITPEFRFVESDKSPELYSALLRSLPEINPKAISDSLELVNRGAIHPLEEDNTTNFFRSLAPQITSKGEFVEGDEPPLGEEEVPRIGRSPVIYLRRRNLGFGVAIESILDDLPNADLKDIPSFLPRVLGLEVNSVNSEEDSSTLTLDPNGEDEEVLFSKEANAEQLQIVKYIQKYGSVLVQGPPGTGKTHTIANLVGHFLAQGKSILITSHTAKALQVLRDKVVEPLQPLCVSVLSGDNRAELENSVNNITERLADSNADLLEQEAKQLEAHRLKLLTNLRQLRDDLKIARFSEYSPIVLNGVEYKPIDAARLVADGANRDNWIPPPVSKDEPCPISENECIELYRLNASLTIDDENNLSLQLPSLDKMLDSKEFSKLIQQKAEYESLDLILGEPFWLPSTVSPSQIRDSFKDLSETVNSVANIPEWLRSITIQGMIDSEKDLWYRLQQIVQNTHEFSSKNRELLLEYEPQLPIDNSPEKIQKIIDEIHYYVSIKGKLGLIKLLLNPKWKSILKNCSVNGYSPSIPKHYEALKAAADLQLMRYKLVQRWKHQVTAINGPILESNDTTPEVTCLKYLDRINKYLGWYSNQFLPALQSLIDCGLCWDKILNQVDAANDQLDLYILAITDILPPIIESKANYIDYQQINEQLATLEHSLRELNTSDGICKDLLEAVKNEDVDAYTQAYTYLRHLSEQAVNYHRRNELLEKVKRVAPTWADLVSNKRDVHGNDTPPGSVLNAWVWRQLNDELDRRASLNVTDIQNDIKTTSDYLRFTTGQLIEKRSWASQIRRINDKQRLALHGWKMIVKKIGKGTGARAPKLKAEARKLMPECQSAVPVWIMPLARLVDNFNPSTNKFDVVIIDEASQADLMSLIAIYMGKQIVIVGDDEQVSPLGVGQKVAELQSLIETMLQGIPNRILYDSTFSIYDLAMTILQPVCLREHFRCVPEIINFSNRLSYDWKIRPLRDTSSIIIKPHLVDYRVEAAVSNGKTNKEEAAVIASLIIACSKEPAYEHATFGVISLVGEEQALIIDSILRKYIDPNEYARRKIQCGNSAHFQGDERDVVFLSMVDTNDKEGPLPIKREGALGMFKKRFNVAASRARDQLWVVYSLNPETDLQDGDLRLQLIQHAKDPNAFARERERVLECTESDFEKQVAGILMDAGYKVIPQWKVGSFRIDMVVEGNGKRLAVECDGDKWHTLDNLQDDMNRQAILERLGWSFVRIRGSQFYRDPQQAMIPVFERLKSMDIAPVLDSNLDIIKNQDNDLLERVKRNAAEIRAKWEEDTEEITYNNPPPHNKWTRQSKVTKAKSIKKNEAAQSEVSRNETISSMPLISELPRKRADVIKEPAAPAYKAMPNIRTNSGSKPSVTQLLRDKGINFIDKRDKGGALWVVGGKELTISMEDIAAHGYKFIFTAKGGRATKHKPGWYYK